MTMTGSISQGHRRMRRSAVRVTSGVGALLLLAIALLAHVAGVAPLAPLSVILLALTALLGTVAVFLSVSETVAPMRAPAAAAPAAALATPEAPAAASEELHPGRRIGRYTLDQRLAVGGMGEVWRASHDTLVRPAAIKIIRRPQDANPEREREWVERFRREAMVTGNLTSPHTVELYDFGVEGGVLYLAMELLSGMSLKAMVESHGPLEEARVAFLIRQACSSLVEAHEGGVVHRDLKPENLFITRAGNDYDYLKVIDFGLVKELAQGPGKRRLTGHAIEAVQLTALGARPGTPGYMAPEQIGGSVVDQRADIYALACVAYFALTGQPVFEGTEDAQLMFAHAAVDAERPSERTGRAMHQGLEDVIMRCLAKNPSARPASMQALDDALAALEFPSPWTHVKARAWWSERMSPFAFRTTVA
jgi:serine/threonine-protein kinase